MWSRAELKAKAKSVLKVSYWKAFLISILLLFTGGHEGGGFNLNWSLSSSRQNNDFSSSIFQPDMNMLWILLGIMGMFFLLLILAIFAFRIFLGYPIEVGGRRYFVQAALSDENMNYLGYSFNKERYMNIVKAMLWRGFINFLWYLLFIIPGIVKSYAYRMVPYILADNPNIGYKRALELSNHMTRGHKWKIFVLDLSFLGWYILGVFALFVGVLFVMPYQNATNAELYLVLRENALQNGLCSFEELNMTEPMNT